VVTGAGLRARLEGALGGRLQSLAGPQGLRLLSKAWLPLGRRVAVVGGDLAAVELAEFLAGRGRRVALLEQGDEIAPEVGPKRRAEHMDALDRAGVTVHTGVRVERIASDGVVLAGETASGEGRVVPADSVVLAGSLEPDTSLHDALLDRVPETFAVGDCTGLGLIQKATEDAARAACSI
jgi:2,4-dienoyl-CoA reductase (NADPH2)